MIRIGIDPSFVEVAEWLNATHSKCVLAATSTWVQIPPSPLKPLEAWSEQNSRSSRLDCQGLSEMTTAYISYRSPSHGLLRDMSEDEFPTQLRGWDDETLNLPSSGTHLGYVWQGVPVLKTPVGGFILQAGMYFCLPGDGIVWGKGQGIVVTRLGYQGVFSIGGPIESTGRLLYIDGATDSVLIHPPRCGDPVLNALYFKPGINQTPHTHSSLRVGMIVSGQGRCVIPEHEEIPLEPGQVFVIPANQLHSFRTIDNPMVVVAFHPDSGCGPTDEVHPMILKTTVNGVSASQLEKIRTRA